MIGITDGLTIIIQLHHIVDRWTLMPRVDPFLSLANQHSIKKSWHHPDTQHEKNMLWLMSMLETSMSAHLNCISKATFLTTKVGLLTKKNGFYSL